MLIFVMIGKDMYSCIVLIILWDVMWIDDLDFVDFDVDEWCFYFMLEMFDEEFWIVEFWIVEF